MNEKLMKALGMLRGVSHTEFIESESDGKFYFWKLLLGSAAPIFLSWFWLL